MLETHGGDREIPRLSAKGVLLAVPNSFGKENPFENVQPLRGQMWTEAEDALDGRDHLERRVSDVPTEEIHRVVTGSSRTSKQTSGQRCSRRNGALLRWYPRRFAGSNRLPLDSGFNFPFHGSVLVSGREHLLLTLSRGWAYLSRALFWHHEVDRGPNSAMIASPNVQQSYQG
jgi:hypothetical protein